VKSIKILFVIVGICFVVSGCEASKGFANGLKQDVTGFWGNAKKMDDWWQENLW